MAKFRNGNLVLQETGQKIILDTTPAAENFGRIGMDSDIGNIAVSGALSVLGSPSNGKRYVTIAGGTATEIRSHTDGAWFRLTADDSGGTERTLFNANPASESSLHYNGEQKLVVGSNSIYVTTIGNPANQYVSLQSVGADAYLQQRYEGTVPGDTTLRLRVRNTGNSGYLNSVVCYKEGQVVLYYDGQDVAETMLGGFILRSRSNNEGQIFVGDDVANLGGLVLSSPNVVYVSAGNVPVVSAGNDGIKLWGNENNNGTAFERFGNLEVTRSGIRTSNNKSDGSGYGKIEHNAGTWQFTHEQANGNVWFYVHQSDNAKHTTMGFVPNGTGMSYVGFYADNTNVLRTYNDGQYYGIHITAGGSSGALFGTAPGTDRLLILNREHGHANSGIHIRQSDGPKIILDDDKAGGMITVSGARTEVYGDPVKFKNAGVQTLSTTAGGIVVGAGDHSAHIRTSGQQLLIANNSHTNNYIQFQGRDSAGAVTNYAAFKDTSTALYYDNSIAVQMVPGGIQTYDAGDATSIYQSGTAFNIRNLSDGGSYLFQQDSAGGSIFNCLAIEGTYGAVTLYYSSFDVLQTRRNGITIRSESNNDNDIFTGDEVANLGDLVLYSPNTVNISGGQVNFYDGGNLVASTNVNGLTVYDPADSANYGRLIYSSNTVYLEPVAPDASDLILRTTNALGSYVNGVQLDGDANSFSVMLYAWNDNVGGLGTLGTVRSNDATSNGIFIQGNNGQDDWYFQWIDNGHPTGGYDADMWIRSSDRPFIFRMDGASGQIRTMSTVNPSGGWRWHHKTTRNKFGWALADHTILTSEYSGIRVWDKGENYAWLAFNPDAGHLTELTLGSDVVTRLNVSASEGLYVTGGVVLRNVSNVESQMFVGQEVANLDDLVLHSTNSINLSAGLINFLESEYGTVVKSIDGQGSIFIGSDVANLGDLCLSCNSGVILSAGNSGGDARVDIQQNRLRVYMDNQFCLDLNGSGLDYVFGEGTTVLRCLRDTSETILGDPNGPNLYIGNDDIRVRGSAGSNIWLSGGGPTGQILRSNSVSGAWIFSSDILPETAGLDIGKNESANRWANIWADLVNGADIALANDWRILESEKYEGYPVGFAIGDGFTEGVVTERVGGKPIFAITKDFIEYDGERLTKDEFKKLIAFIKNV